MFHLKRKGLFTASMIVLMLLALVPTHWTRAASAYAISPTAGTVGTATAFTITYTTDSGTGVGQQTWAAGDTLTIGLPLNSSIWDIVTITSVKVGTTDIAAGTENGQYEKATRTMTIHWGAIAGDWAGNSVVTVVVTINPNYALASSAITFGGATVSGDDDDPLDSTSAVVVVSAAAANSTLGLAGNSVVGASGDTIFTVNVPKALVQNATIVFTAPANLDISGATYSTSKWGAGAGYISGCEKATQTITCTVGATGLGVDTAGTLTFTGITSKYAATGQNLSGISVTKDGVLVITSGTSGAVTETTQAAAAGALGLAGNAVVAATGDTTLTVTTPVALLSGATIVFVAPANLNVVSVAFKTGGTLGDNFSGCAASGQVVTCTANGAVSAVSGGTLLMTGITSKYAITSQTIGGLAVKESTVSGVTASSTAAVTETTAAAAAGALAMVGNAVVGVSGDTTLTITTPLTIAQGGTIVFVAPANLNVASAAYSSDTFGAGENFTAGTGCAAVGQVITCTVKTGGSLSATTGNIVLTGIKAAYVKAIQSAGIGGLAIKEATVSAVTASSTASVPATTVGALSGPMILPNNSVAGTIGTVKINFTTVTTIPNLGKIVIVAPSQFSVSGVNGTTASALSGLDGTWTAAVSGQTITLTQTSGTATTAGAKSLTLSSVQNTQAAAGSFADAFSITTKTAASENIETVNSTNKIEILYGGNNTSSQYFSVNTPVVTFVPPSTSTIQSPIIPITTTTPATAVKPLPTPAPVAAPTVIQNLLTKPSFDVVQAKSAVNSISQDKSLVAPTSGTPNCTPNSLIKGTSNKTVYYCGQNGKRFVFPNEKTYKTWFVDFSNVSQVSDTDLSKIPLGGNATYKPGAKLIKIQTDPKVYAVAPGGVLRWIGSEVLAAKYYGTKWNKQIDDVSDAFFTNYKIGTPITE